MATVQKRGSKWYAIFKDKAGKWRQQVGYTDKGQTRKLAQRLEDEAHAIANGDVDPQADARRLERAKPAQMHLDMLKAEMEAKCRHPRHIHFVIENIRRFIAFSGVTTAAAITRPMIAAWQTHCLTVGYPTQGHDKPIVDSPKTVNHRLSSVRAWLRYLTNIGAIDRCIMEGHEMLHTKGHETFRRRALTSAEATALVEKCPDPHRKELYRFALLTGLRRSEIASLTLASFNFDQKTIFLSAASAKTKTAHAIIPMHGRLVEPLKTLCKDVPPDAPVFHIPHRTNVVPILHADCRAAGIDTKDVDFHALRHTFCSLLAAQGIRPEVLMKLARHRAISTTMRFYVHFKADDEREAINGLMA